MDFATADGKLFSCSCERGLSALIEPFSASKSNLTRRITETCKLQAWGSLAQLLLYNELLCTLITGKGDGSQAGGSLDRTPRVGQGPRHNTQTRVDAGRPTTQCGESGRPKAKEETEATWVETIACARGKVSVCLGVTCQQASVAGSFYSRRPHGHP